jgi:hypothetical protein
MLRQRKIVITEAGEAGLDNARANIGFGDRSESGTRRTLEISELENLYWSSSGPEYIRLWRSGFCKGSRDLSGWRYRRCRRAERYIC